MSSSIYRKIYRKDRSRRGFPLIDSVALALACVALALGLSDLVQGEVRGIYLLIGGLWTGIFAGDHLIARRSGQAATKPKSRALLATAFFATSGPTITAVSIYNVRASLTHLVGVGLGLLLTGVAVLMLAARRDSD